MTQVEAILTMMEERFPGGLTHHDLHDRLGISKGSLGTTLWELKNDGLIARIGGKRGSYIYGITKKGREYLTVNTTGTRDPAELAEVLGGDFDEILKIVGKSQEFKELRRFVSWIAQNKADELRSGGDLERTLNGAVLEYIGVDLSKFEEQRESLEVILSVV